MGLILPDSPRPSGGVPCRSGVLTFATLGPGLESTPTCLRRRTPLESSAGLWCAQLCSPALRRFVAAWVIWGKESALIWDWWRLWTEACVLNPPVAPTVNMRKGFWRPGQHV